MIYAMLDRMIDRITDKNIEWGKSVATKLGRPWVRNVSITFDDGDPRHGAYEMDWNDAFIKFLRSNGYDDIEDEQEIINQWMVDVARDMVFEDEQKDLNVREAPTDPGFHQRQKDAQEWNDEGFYRL